MRAAIHALGEVVGKKDGLDSLVCKRDAVVVILEYAFKLHVVQQPVVLSGAAGNKLGVFGCIGLKQYLNVGGLALSRIGHGRKVVGVFRDKILDVGKIQRQRLMCVAVARVTVFGRHIERKCLVRILIAEFQIERRLIGSVFRHVHTAEDAPGVASEDEHMLRGGQAYPAILERGLRAVERALLRAAIHALGEVVFVKHHIGETVSKGYSIIIIRFRGNRLAAGFAEAVAVFVNVVWADILHFLDHQVVDEPVVDTLLPCRDLGPLFCIGLKQNLHMSSVAFLTVSDRGKVVGVFLHKVHKISKIKRQRLICVAKARVVSLRSHIEVELADSVLVP